MRQAGSLILFCFVLPPNIFGDSVVCIHVGSEPGESPGVVHSADLALVALPAVLVDVVGAQHRLVANLVTADGAVVDPE